MVDNGQLVSDDYQQTQPMYDELSIIQNISDQLNALYLVNYIMIVVQELREPLSLLCSALQFSENP